MKKFEFHVDQKVTTWYRETHVVEAENYDKAEEMMKKAFLNEDEEYEYFVHQEEIDNTLEDMTPEENGGQTTRELFYRAPTKTLTILKNGE